MSDQPGIYEITNNEGMICFVDTVTSGKKTYGKDWQDVCASTLNGTILKAEISKYQYRTHEGEPIDDKPTDEITRYALTKDINYFSSHDKSDPLQ